MEVKVARYALVLIAKVIYHLDKTGSNFYLGRDGVDVEKLQG